MQKTEHQKNQRNKRKAIKGNVKVSLKNIPIGELHPHPNNPYAMREDTEFQESIKEYGVMSPLMVRPIESGGYEIISGHRRRAAAETAGMEKVPVYICDLNDTEAVIALVDSNMHREQILPSEKAFAYKLKLEAVRKQAGRPSKENPRQVVANSKSADIVGQGAGESGRTIQRFIRLTELIPQILQMVDEGKIAFSPAVEISHLPKKEQADLLETMQSEDRTPNLSQCLRMRKLSAAGQLDMDAVFSIMTEEKSNQKEQIKFKADDLRKFFKKNVDAQQMEQIILKLLGEYQRKRERSEQERER
jgi:ParB family chromosome partitioning protein